MHRLCVLFFRSLYMLCFALLCFAFISFSLFFRFFLLFSVFFYFFFIFKNSNRCVFRFPNQYATLFYGYVCTRYDSIECMLCYGCLVPAVCSVFRVFDCWCAEYSVCSFVCLERQCFGCFVILCERKRNDAYINTTRF